MDSTTNNDSTGGFGSFDLSPRKDWNSFNDDKPESLEYEPAYPLQVRHLFESAVGRCSSATTGSRGSDVASSFAAMNLPREILYQVFDHLIAPFKEYPDDNLVPQSFRGKGIRFQVVESPFSPESLLSTDDLIVTGEVSSRNLNQVTGTRQTVDPLATYREIQSGTAETIPDGWLQSEEVARELEQLSWNEDEISEEDTEEDSDSDQESSEDNTSEDGEDTAASAPRASRHSLDREVGSDPDGVKRAFLATNRRDDTSCVKPSSSGEPSSSRSAKSSVPTSPLVSAPSSPFLKPAIDIPESSIPATAEDDIASDLLHLDPAIFADDDQSSDPLEYLDYGFVMVYKPNIWETDEEIVALENSRHWCPRSTTYEARCRFRPPVQYQNLLRLSQLSPGVTEELGKTLYPNCTAEFPYGPHLFPSFAAERPAILPMLRGIILHLDCSADFNDTVTTELAYMLSFFSPSLRPDSPCRKLAFLTVKLRTSLVDIPRWQQEEDSMEKQLIMDKLREWAPLFRAVHTDELLLSLVGIRHEVFSAAQGVPYGFGQEDREREMTTREIRAMWWYAGLLEWRQRWK
ncbi:hypothetical protein B0H65DRAFT_507701 [Neurospora tetraspora]|uniref:Uncharacterized protein n=1 Tax=Neurospora tetraspora TaxID=94610 RepID=A0AAE0JI41_9PEZI|nr:hypothetical protein B0H65DRAFT_507701 [Neurospora tetraspora]